MRLTDIMNEIERRGALRDEQQEPALDSGYGAQAGATVRAGRAWAVSLDAGDTDASTGPIDSPAVCPRRKGRRALGSFLRDVRRSAPRW